MPGPPPEPTPESTPEPPPEVPEEYAATYRTAYERALAAQSDGPTHREPPPDDGDDARGPDALPSRRERLRVGTHRTPAAAPAKAPPARSYDDVPTAYERVRDSRWFVPVLLALLAMALVLGAYAVGRSFAGKVASDEKPSSEPSVVMSDAGSDSTRAPVSHQAAAQGAWTGTVSRLGGVTASAGCTSRSGVDASGGEVSYAARNLTDGVADTTWRCDGTAVGQKITLDLGKRVAIGEVGLIPGYAKTDRASGEDRYAENNRVTRVRWSVGQTQVEQRLSPSTTDRSLRVVRVPRTTTDMVTLEILEVAKGPRDTTAISEVSLGRAG